MIKLLRCVLLGVTLVGLTTCISAEDADVDRSGALRGETITGKAKAEEVATVATSQTARRAKPEPKSNPPSCDTTATSGDFGSLTNPYDVVVVGLGWAGIHVLKELQNYKDFLAANGGTNCDFKFVGLEYEADAGGRARAAELSSGGGNPIDEYIWKFFKNDLVVTAQKWSDVAYHMPDGTEIESKILNEQLNAWATAYECLQEKAEDGAFRSADMDTILKNECSWDVTAASSSLSDKTAAALKKTLAWYEQQYEFLQSHGNSNAFGNVPLLTYTGEYIDRDYFITAERNSATIAEAVFNKYVISQGGYSPNDVQRLNTLVTQIDWTNDPIEVVSVSTITPSVPNTYYARNVVVTASTGMMKKYLDVSDPFVNGAFFEPKLPPEKLTSIKNLFFKQDSGFRDDLGLYKKLWVRFNQTTWTNDIKPNTPNTEFTFVVPVEGQIDYSNPNIQDSEVFCSIWQHLDTGFKKGFFEDSKAFVCTLVSKEFDSAWDATTKMIPDATLKEIIKLSLLKGVLGFTDSKATVLANKCQRKTGDPGLFPPTTVQDECEFYIFDGPELADTLNASDPTVDRLWNGGWPHFSPGWTEDEFACARANLQNETSCVDGGDNARLWFASDALCRRFHGFQHGAVQYGTQIGNAIARAELSSPSDATFLDLWKNEYENPEFCDDIPVGGPGNYRKSKTSA